MTRARGAPTLAAVVLLAAGLAGTAHGRPSDTRGASLAGLEGEVARCPDQSALAGHRVRVAAVIYPDGEVGVAVGPWSPALGPTDDAAAAALTRCIGDAVRARLAGLARRAKTPRLVVHTLELRADVDAIKPERAQPQFPATHGRSGEICRFGEHWRASDPTLALPTPAPCGKGLLCCSGGPAGSDSICVAGTTCPQWP